MKPQILRRAQDREEYSVSAPELRALREKLHMTQWEFGVWLGYSEKRAQVTISEFERGVKPIPERAALRCLMILDPRR